MKLGIISDCIHYKTPDGKVGTENHILLRQLEALCSYYTGTLICCPFEEYDPGKVISFYNSQNINFLPLPVVGGESIAAKIKLLSTLVIWWKAFRKIDRFSDIVYQRFPNNVNIPGFFYFWLKRKKVFATYTGTWGNFATEAATYRFQRWLLRNLFSGPVWVYAAAASENSSIHNGFSPSYNIAEWEEETSQVEARIANIRQNGLPLFRLITVGTLIGYKNQMGILKTCVLLKQQNFLFQLTVVGDGPMRHELQKFVDKHDLQNEVTLVGKKKYAALRELYRTHDFVVQAPHYEGFGKVPVEGFFHGVIPVINNISMAEYMTANGQRGFLFDAADPKNLAAVLQKIAGNIAVLPEMIAKGREFARSQTLEAWAADYHQKVNDYFG